MKTRNGIFYDLSKSNYKYCVPDTGLTFVFSSDLHWTKFEEQFKQNREEFNIKYQARFRINLRFTSLPDILLYKRIEKRGFLMLNERGQKIWQENLILVGEKATPKS